jgi:hypothetical protein
VPWRERERATWEKVKEKRMKSDMIWMVVWGGEECNIMEYRHSMRWSINTAIMLYARRWHSGYPIIITPIIFACHVLLTHPPSKENPILPPITFLCRNNKRKERKNTFFFSSSIAIIDLQRTPHKIIMTVYFVSLFVCLLISIPHKVIMRSKQTLFVIHAKDCSLFVSFVAT